jgi:hypothetical protein
MQQPSNEEIEQSSQEFQAKIIEIAGEYSSKLPADVIILAMAFLTGKFFDTAGGFGMKKNRLKTLMRKKMGI